MLIKSFTLIFKEKRETAAKQPTDDAHHSAPLLRAPARRVDDGGDDNQTAGRQGGAGRPVQWGTRKVRTSSLVHLPRHANSPPPSLPGMTTATKDNPTPAPRPRATARGVDNGCNFEGSRDGEMTTAPAPTATGPATDTGSNDDTGDSTRNDTNEHQDPQNAKNGRSTPQPRQTTQHPPPCLRATARRVDRGCNLERTRETERKKGPRDIVDVSWATGVFFFSFSFHFHFTNKLMPLP